MVRIEFKKDNTYSVVIDFNRIKDLHVLIDELIEFVGDYKTSKIISIQYDDEPTTDEEQQIIIPSILNKEPLPIPVIDYKTDEDEYEPEVVINQKEPINEPVELNATDYKKLLEQTDISVNSYKNYPFQKDPIWCMLNDPVKILNYLKERVDNVGENNHKIQSLYRLFTLFFKLNNIHKYISNNDDLTTLNNLFTPIKAQKNLVSKKKTPSNVPK